MDLLTVELQNAIDCPVCGDGLKQGGEQCDDGNIVSGDGCSVSCTIEPGWSCPVAGSPCIAICGDGIKVGTEECDDGNTKNEDGCSHDCTVEHGWACQADESPPPDSVCTSTCGDGLIAIGAETCDDDNTAPYDGCWLCQTESGWACTGEPSECRPIPHVPPYCADIPNLPNGKTIATKIGMSPWETWTHSGLLWFSNVAGTPPKYTQDMISYLQNALGTGTFDTGAMEIDKRNWVSKPISPDMTDPWIGYLPLHTDPILLEKTDLQTDIACETTFPPLETSFCPNGFVEAPSETCDDGNTNNGDGCDHGCHIEAGFTCTGNPSVCVSDCGDGVITGNEQCDDGNTMSGDGCSSTCTIEPGWTCPQAGSPCSLYCADLQKAYDQKRLPLLPLSGFSNPTPDVMMMTVSPFKIDRWFIGLDSTNTKNWVAIDGGGPPMNTGQAIARYQQFVGDTTNRPKSPSISVLGTNWTYAPSETWQRLLNGSLQTLTTVQLTTGLACATQVSTPPPPPAQCFDLANAADQATIVVNYGVAFPGVQRTWTYSAATQRWSSGWVTPKTTPEMITELQTVIGSGSSNSIITFSWPTPQSWSWILSGASPQWTATGVNPPLTPLQMQQAVACSLP